MLQSTRMLSAMAASWCTGEQSGRSVHPSIPNPRREFWMLSTLPTLNHRLEVRDNMAMATTLRRIHKSRPPASPLLPFSNPDRHLMATNLRIPQPFLMLQLPMHLLRLITNHMASPRSNIQARNRHSRRPVQLREIRTSRRRPSQQHQAFTTPLVRTEVTIMEPMEQTHRLRLPWCHRLGIRKITLRS